MVIAHCETGRRYAVEHARTLRPTGWTPLAADELAMDVCRTW